MLALSPKDVSCSSMMRWLQVLRKRRRGLRLTRLAWREPLPGTKTEEIGFSSEMAGANR
jgi:hypothetical protein